jgi:hypothetical protein
MKNTIYYYLISMVTGKWGRACLANKVSCDITLLFFSYNMRQMKYVTSVGHQINKYTHLNITFRTERGHHHHNTNGEPLRAKSCEKHRGQNWHDCNIYGPKIQFSIFYKTKSQIFRFISARKKWYDFPRCA